MLRATDAISLSVINSRSYEISRFAQLLGISSFVRARAHACKRHERVLPKFRIIFQEYPRPRQRSSTARFDDVGKYSRIANNRRSSYTRRSLGLFVHA